MGKATKVLVWVVGLSILATLGMCTMICGKVATNPKVQRAVEQTTQLSQPQPKKEVALPREEEKVIVSLSGRGLKKTKPFDVGDRWEVRWATKGAKHDLFVLYLYEQDSNVPQVIANSSGTGQDSSYIAEGGNYRMDINATGQWKIDVVQLK